MSGLMKFFGVDKVLKTFSIIKANGGIKGSLYTIYRTDDLRNGTLIGVDKYGNKYFQDDTFFIGRNRYVVYNEKSGIDYDGSMVPAEWFGWLHYKTDFPPTIKPPVKYDWMTDHSMNRSGTHDSYMPYSTTKPKVETWTPKKKSSE